MQNNSTQTHIPEEIFRAYDIRGIVGKTLSSDIAYLVGRAVGTQIRQTASNNNVYVGYDGRHSSPSLAKALSQGLMDCGCHVLNLGSIPTPVLYFATWQPEATSGIMITGSHNPKDYNGFKIVVEHETLALQAIQDLYTRILANDFVQGEGSLTDHPIDDIYLKYITDSIQLARPLKVVVDAGNGIPGKLAPRLFSSLGCDVIPLFCEVDGNFPNHHPDPTEIENLNDIIETVRKEGADCGLAFDGDGDRVGIVTNQGEIIYADQLMMLFAKDLLAKYPGKTVIYDVKCSKILEQIIQTSGGKGHMTRTGHSLVKKALADDPDAIFAGELSGHIFLRDRWFGFDDGLYTGCRLLEILANESQSLSDHFALLPKTVNTPELKIPMPDDEKFKFMDSFIAQAQFKQATCITIDGLRVEFENGFGLLRASNTTPFLIARFEADSREHLMHIIDLFKTALISLREHIDLSALPTN